MTTSFEKDVITAGVTTDCVAYTRCSGASQIDGDSFPRQLSSIESFCNQKDIQIIREYRDEAIPGKLDEESRPGFQRMISDLLDNGCRTIVVERMQRLAREYRTQEHLIIYIASKGITLLSADTGEDITAAMMGDPMRRALVQIQGIFGELDKNLTIDKLAKARKRIKVEGRKFGAKNYSPDPVANRNSEGRKPFGQKPGEEATLQEILLLANLGKNCSQIADVFNFRKVPSRRGGPWRGTVIAKIIARERKKPVARQTFAA